MMTFSARHPYALFPTCARTSSGNSTAAVKSPAFLSLLIPPTVRLSGKRPTAALVKVLTLVALLSISVALIAGLAGGFFSPLSLSVFVVLALLVLLFIWMTVRTSRVRSFGPTKDKHPIPPFL